MVGPLHVNFEVNIEEAPESPPPGPPSPAPAPVPPAPIPDGELFPSGTYQTTGPLYQFL